MKIKLNNSGSALVWVLVICIIFGILGVAIGGIALSMNNRSVNNNASQQAYFTARSAVNLVASQINGGKESSGPDIRKNLFGTENLNESAKKDKGALTFNNVNFDDSMGIVKNLTAEYTNDNGKEEVKITAEAEKGGQKEIVILYLGKEVTPVPPLPPEPVKPTWPEVPSKGDGDILQTDNQGKKLIDTIGAGGIPSVYHLTESNKSGSEQKLNIVSGSKEVFIFVDDNCSLNLWERTGDQTADVFILLRGENSKVVFQNNKDTSINNLYIYGFNEDTQSKVGSVEVEKNNAKIEINGYVFVKSVGDRITVKEKVPSDLKYDIDENGNLKWENTSNGTNTSGDSLKETIEWVPVRYEKEN